MWNISEYEQRLNNSNNEKNKQHWKWFNFFVCSHCQRYCWTKTTKRKKNNKQTEIKFVQTKPNYTLMDSFKHFDFVVTSEALKTVSPRFVSTWMKKYSGKYSSRKQNPFVCCTILYTFFSLVVMYCWEGSAKHFRLIARMIHWIASIVVRLKTNNNNQFHTTIIIHITIHFLFFVHRCDSYGKCGNVKIHHSAHIVASGRLLLVYIFCIVLANKWPFAETFYSILL